jgi:gluconokinase
MNASVVFMGVAGCGKSSLGAAVAAAERLPLVEGDDFHSPESRAKMAQGIALTDADRDGWLTRLGQELQQHLGGPRSGAVLTCSALKHSYRQRLRTAVPGLRFVFLDIGRADAQARVAARAAHFFSASLIDSQFATLEVPTGEPGVLRVDALNPLAQLQTQVSTWLRTGDTA